MTYLTLSYLLKDFLFFVTSVLTQTLDRLTLLNVTSILKRAFQINQL